MSAAVDAWFRKAGKWQEEMKRLRKIILATGLTEELKWGKPCYTHDGSNVVILQGFKESCALLFCKGARLKDPKGILKKPGENTQAARRIEFTDVAQIAKLESKLKTYLKEAVAVEKAGLEVAYKTVSEFAVPDELKQKLDTSPSLRSAFEALTPGRQRGYLLYFSSAKQSKTRESRIEKYRQQILKGKGLHDHEPKPTSKGNSPPRPRKSRNSAVVLLSGGNPQIAKGEGDAPVQAYIAAMPGWKSDFGRRLDALITRTIPKVRKAVKWNSPFYGIEGQGWLLSFHVFTRYVKVTFFKGTSLNPIPAGGTEKSREVRWIDVYESDGLNEAQITKWIKQAAALPGWVP